MVANIRLNEQAPYRIFCGRYIDVRLALRKTKRIPMTLRQIAEKRLEVLSSGDEALIHYWWDNRYCTSDGVAYFGDEIKVLKNSQLLMGIIPGAELKNGALILTEEQYNNLEGKTFQRSELIIDERLTKKQAKEHPVWQELLGDVLDEYVDAVFEQYEKNGESNKLMGVYVYNTYIPALCTWSIGMLETESDLPGSYDLNGGALLIGILSKK